jgi:predicted NAD/FAD-dependent oxidoreductase
MGQKQAAYDGSGKIIAFYDVVESPAPAGVTTINITDEQWLNCIQNHAKILVQNGALVDAPAPTAAVLLAEAQTEKQGELSAACQAAIVSGFQSSALGSVHAYPSALIDQQNLASSVLASIMPGLATDWTAPIWCADSTGSWLFQPHTAAQAQQVGADSTAAIQALRTKNATLQAEVQAATTAAAVQAVTWALPS